MTDVDTSMDSVNSQDQPQPADLSVCSSKRGTETDMHVSVYPKSKEEDETHLQGLDREDLNGEDNSVDLVKVKNESMELSQATLEHPEGNDLPYGYGTDCAPYKSIQLERHSSAYDLSRPGLGKLYCDICGLACNSLNVLLVHKRSHTAVEEPKQMKPEIGSDRAMVLDRIANNVAKRKSSMPQKFTGEKRQCFEVPYNSFLYDKDHDMIPPRMLEQNTGNPIAYLSPGVLHPLVHTPPTPTAEMVPVISSLYSLPLTRIDMSNGHLPSQLIKEKKPAPERGLSPGANAHDSTDTDSSHEERPSYPPNLNAGSVRTNSVLQPPKEHPRGFDLLKHPGLSQRDLLQLLSKDGCPLGVYRCDHCHVLFLDYVMFTIHMGCHGFRDPFECNMCGHRSQDRYEFSSHIARGEHRLGMN
ncbi:zinc finger protein Aiolos isoform X4 [Pyxicephalus adspersus]|uniref:zinc finger protein Aiolos isoform X4 n=1 Tax=Pyxicephalus adspersus TaxID=30357 RepID=UPI003B5969D3